MQVPSGPPKKLALYKTRSIGDQVCREVNIEDAIAASQSDLPTHTSSQGDKWRVGRQGSGRSQSIDVSHLLDTNTGKKKSKKLFGHKKVCEVCEVCELCIFIFLQMNSFDLLDGPSDSGRPLSVSLLAKLYTHSLTHIHTHHTDDLCTSPSLH